MLNVTDAEHCNKFRLDDIFYMRFYFTNDRALKRICRNFDDICITGPLETVNMTTSRVANGEKWLHFHYSVYLLKTKNDAHWG